MITADARRTNAPGTDGDQNPSALETYIADGLLGALSSPQWQDFEKNGFVYGPVYDTRTRRRVHPDEVRLTTSPWRVA